MTKWNRLRGTTTTTAAMLFEDGGGTSFRFSALLEDAGDTKGEGPKKFFFRTSGFAQLREIARSVGQKSYPQLWPCILQGTFLKESYSFLNIYLQNHPPSKKLYDTVDPREQASTIDTLILERRKLGHYKFFPRRKKSYGRQKENEEGEEIRAVSSPVSQSEEEEGFFCSQRKRDGRKSGLLLAASVSTDFFLPSSVCHHGDCQRESN